MAEAKKPAAAKSGGGKGKRGVGASASGSLARGDHKKGATPRFQSKYTKDVVAELKKRHPKMNAMELPRFVKIVVATCQGEATQDIKVIETATAELEQITGQKPLISRAKKSIATFKLRAGIPIGATVTLRKQSMYEFYDRLVSIALPRVRDFRGVSTTSFDGRGNYSIGFREQTVFPEIESDKVEKTRGISVTIVTSAKNDDAARELLTLMEMPFKK